MPSKGGKGWSWWLERAGPVLALVLLIAGTAIYESFKVPPDERVFLTFRNFANIFGQYSFVGIVAIGMTFVIILGGIDLSVGSMVALAGGASLFAMNAVSKHWGWGPGPAIAVAIAVCFLGGPVMGLVNGVAIAKGRLAPFVATLGTLAIFRSLIVAPAEGSEIRSEVPAFADIGSATVDLPVWMGGIPASVADDGSAISATHVGLRVSVLVFLGCAVLAHLVLTRTVFGRQVYAIGDNAKAARYAGVKSGRVTMAVYAIAGLTCGIAALLNASRLNSVSSSTLGLFYELDAIAAVVIGGTRLSGGSGRVWGTVIGVLIMGVVANMLNMLDVNSHWQGLVKGLIIIAAVLVQRPGRAE